MEYVKVVAKDDSDYKFLVGAVGDKVHVELEIDTLDENVCTFSDWVSANADKLNEMIRVVITDYNTKKSFSDTPQPKS